MARIDQDQLGCATTVNRVDASLRKQHQNQCRLIGRRMLRIYQKYAEAQALADDLGLTRGDVKRMAFRSPQRD
jgi:hypothetical protein